MDARLGVSRIEGVTCGAVLRPTSRSFLVQVVGRVDQVAITAYDTELRAGWLVTSTIRGSFRRVNGQERVWNVNGSAG